MLRFKLRQLMTDYEFREQRRLTMTEIAEATGIVRTTLSRIAGPKPFNTSTNNLERLCEFFACPIEALVEYVPDGSKPPRD